MRPSKGRYARILVDSGLDEHVCPTDFASPTPLGPTKVGTLYDAQGHIIVAPSTRTMYIEADPKVRAWVQSSESRGEVGQTRFPLEAGPAGCEMSKGDRSVTLDVGWTSELAKRLKELAMLMHDSFHQC